MQVSVQYVAVMVYTGKAFTLQQAMKAQRGVDVQLCSFFNFSARWDLGGQRHVQAALPPGKGPEPTVQKTWRAPGPVWTGAENVARTGIRSPNRSARSESLYRLSYPGPAVVCTIRIYTL